MPWGHGAYISVLYIRGQYFTGLRTIFASDRPFIPLRVHKIPIITTIFEGCRWGFPSSRIRQPEMFSHRRKWWKLFFCSFACEFNLTKTELHISSYERSSFSLSLSSFFTVYFFIGAATSLTRELRSRMKMSVNECHELCVRRLFPGLLFRFI